MKHLKSFSEAKSIDTPNSKEAKRLNKIHNNNNIPKRDRYQQPHHPGTDMAQVDIGESEPVKKFKEWDGNYWETNNYKKDRKKRQKKGETANNARVQP